MRIVVDLNRCLGYAQCVPLAPKTIKLAGEEALEYDPTPDDAQRKQVLRAAASCPVQGIIVDRLGSRRIVSSPTNGNAFRWREDEGKRKTCEGRGGLRKMVLRTSLPHRYTQATAR